MKFWIFGAIFSLFAGISLETNQYFFVYPFWYLALSGLIGFYIDFNDP